MGIVIDSSVLIAMERGQLHPEAIAAASEPVAIAAITASELLHGVHRARTEEQRAKREAFVERFLERMPVFPFDLVVARVHARLWAAHAAKGEAIGVHDLQIAATAMAYDFAVATRDARNFPRVVGLRLVTL